jgi:transcriptional regulator with XRE-family HTH domain
MNIGKKLQSIRKEKGISQRELAARAGLTNGTISLIEQNKTSPSIASLKRLLDAIPMSIADFFATLEESNDPKIFFKAEEFTEIAPQTGAETISLRQLGNANKHALQILYETYPPDADTGLELLSHNGEEGGIVIEGEIEITVGDQAKILGPGEGYLFNSRQLHRFRNLGSKTCRVISACTPPTF